MKGQKETPELVSEVLTGQGTRQGHLERLQRYSAAKQHQLAIVEYISHLPEMIKEYEAIEACGCWLLFRWWLHNGEKRLVAGIHCNRHLLCFLCALRRSAKQVQAYGKKIQLILTEHPEYIPVLITRTIVNGSDLNERYEHFVGSHRKMMQHRRDALKIKTTARGRKSILRFVKGSAGSYEFKRGKNSGLWHPHSHEIALLDPCVQFTPQIRKEQLVNVPLEFESELSKEWHKATGDSFMVDVRMIDARTEETLFKSVCEAFKYSLKLTDLAIPDQVEAYKVLRGRRLVFSYGCLFGVKVPASLNDEVEEDLSLMPFIDLLFKYQNGGYILEEMDNTGRLSCDPAPRPMCYYKGQPVYSKKYDRLIHLFDSGKETP